jgi:hypothetical protein
LRRFHLNRKPKIVKGSALRPVRDASVTRGAPILLVLALVLRPRPTGLKEERGRQRRTRTIFPTPSGLLNTYHQAERQGPQRKNIPLRPSPISSAASTVSTTIASRNGHIFYETPYPRKGRR